MCVAASVNRRAPLRSFYRREGTSAAKFKGIRHTVQDLTGRWSLNAAQSRFIKLMSPTKLRTPLFNIQELRGKRSTTCAISSARKKPGVSGHWPTPKPIRLTG